MILVYIVRFSGMPVSVVALKLF